MGQVRTSPDFLNGVPELLVLQLLARRAMHGYQLVQEIREGSGQVLSFGEGSIYPTLHRLEEQGCLAARREQAAGRSRVVYHVTARGKARLDRAKLDWQTIAAAVRRLLEGEDHGRPTLGPVPAG